MSTTLRPTTHPPRHHARRAIVRWTKRGLLGLGGAAALAGIVRAFIPAPVSVDTAVVTHVPLDVEISEDGLTRVRDRFIVAAPISGELERVALEAGATIACDDVVARIAPARPALLDARTRDELTARLAAARARAQLAATAITRATVARDAAVRDAERARHLAQQAAITAVEREHTELGERLAVEDLTAAKAQLAAATAEASSIAAMLGETAATSAAMPVLAPTSGRVLRVVRESAGPVVAGTPLVELGDVAHLEVVIDVLSSDAAHVAPGMLVHIDAGDTPVSGRVRLVEPSAFTRVSALGVEEQRVNVIATLDATATTLGDGFRVDTRIVTWHGDAVLVVPTSALFRDHGEWAVYAIDHDRAQLRRVTIGHRGRALVEISSGLDAGTRVIVHPSDQVVDGRRVEPR